MDNNIGMKVCGMRDPGNIADVSRLHPDFLGFIFYAPSPRYVGDDFKMPPFPSTIRRVGVFVNETNAVILQKVKEHQLDFVQLHGGESVQQCRELKTSGVGVIKVFSVDDETDFSITQSYRDAVDYFLFDTKGKLYGGNAVRFNWEVLSRYDQSVPFFLSGGITPDHVTEINDLEKLNLVAIDVNSGVEVRPGWKDPQRIEEIKAKLNDKK
ncbi:MAG TPA: phosphoribosylanthranilate isomerase [Chryseosolibacter sp.]|nr:phosphoribosylanthranilate isomerase [Chryseosolibacter sp.]